MQPSSRRGEPLANSLWAQAPTYNARVMMSAFDVHLLYDGLEDPFVSEHRTNLRPFFYGNLPIRMVFVAGCLKETRVFTDSVIPSEIESTCLSLTINDGTGPSLEIKYNSTLRNPHELARQQLIPDETFVCASGPIVQTATGKRFIEALKLTVLQRDSPSQEARVYYETFCVRQDILEKGWVPQKSDTVVEVDDLEVLTCTDEPPSLIDAPQWTGRTQSLSDFN